MSHQILSSLIWSVADLLRGDFKQSEYGRVILPFTILRRLDCLLEDEYSTSSAEFVTRSTGCLDTEDLGHTSAEYTFYKNSAINLGKLLEGRNCAQQDLDAYIQQFSPPVIDIFERLDFYTQVERLAEVGLLHLVVLEFFKIDLHLAAVSHSRMGDIFDSLIGKVAEISNEVAGEYFTPRDIVSLMVGVVFSGNNESVSADAKRVTVYDPTAGTGGLLSMADAYFKEKYPDTSLDAFGQELNDESAAICKANMLFRGKNFSNIVVGNTLAEDGYAGEKFDYMLSNPPLGVEWKKVEKIIRQEHEKKGFEGRFGPGLAPSTPKLSGLIVAGMKSHNLIDLASRRVSRAANMLALPF